MKTNFSKAELERYSRHIIIPEFNIEGQRKLREASVLVVGAGGLGAPLLQYLTAAGVGRIGLIDPDIIEDSNLQRQVLFNTMDIGRPKVEVAVEKLRLLNPYITFKPHYARLESANAKKHIGDYDIVADGTDNFPTRYLVNDACVLLGKVNVYGSIFRFEGQVSVFNALHEDGFRGPNYRDLFPTPPPPGLVPSCAEGGVLGVLPGMIGSMQANEVIKLITGVGEPLSGRLFLFDAAEFQAKILKIAKDPANPLNGTNPTILELIDYEEFCGIGQISAKDQDDSHVKDISVNELLTWRKESVPHTLIDVREQYEYDIANLGGKLIPKKEVFDRLSDIPKEGHVVVYCRTGRRSSDVIRQLQSELGYTNLLNLKGGILAWATEIDQTIPRY